MRVFIVIVLNHMHLQDVNSILQVLLKLPFIFMQL